MNFILFFILFFAPILSTSVNLPPEITCQTGEPNCKPRAVCKNNSCLKNQANKIIQYSVNCKKNPNCYSIKANKEQLKISQISRLVKKPLTPLFHKKRKTALPHPSKASARWFTLNPDIVPLGPYLPKEKTRNTNEDDLEKQKFVQAIFRNLILESYDLFSKSAYYTSHPKSIQQDISRLVKRKKELEKNIDILPDKINFLEPYYRGWLKAKAQLEQKRKETSEIMKQNIFSGKDHKKQEKDIQNLMKKISEMDNQIRDFENLKSNLKHYQTKLIKIKKRLPSLKEDLKIAKKNLDQNYDLFSFFVLSLAVPHHESVLSHIRKTTAKSCKLSSQNRYGLKRVRSKDRKFWKNHYKEPGDYGVILPDCNTLSKDQEVYQIMASFDFNDYGLPQVNYKFHPQYLYPNVYLNMYASARYGIAYLEDGDGDEDGDKSGGGYLPLRDRLRHVIGKKSRICRRPAFNPYKKLGSDQSSVYYDLIRNVWDIYNGGPKGGNCRFTNRNRKNYGNSKAFKRSLDSIVLHQDSMYHRYLPKNSLERASLDEIIYNFQTSFTKKKEKMQYANLLALLSKTNPYRPDSLKFNKEIKPNVVTQKGDPISFYHSPEINQEYLCGSIRPGTKINLDLKQGYESLTLVEQDDKIFLWGKIDLPTYYHPIQYKDHTKDTFIQKSVSISNVRDKPTTRGSTVISQLTKKNDLKLKYISSQGNWHKVKMNGGGVGWIHRNVAEKIQDNKKYEDQEQFMKDIENKEKCGQGYFYVLMQDIKINQSKNLDLDNKVYFAYVYGNLKTDNVQGENLRQSPSGTLEAYLSNKTLLEVIGVSQNKKWYHIKKVPLVGEDDISGWMWHKSVQIITEKKGD